MATSGELWQKNLKLITPFQKKMNNKLLELWEKLMLRKRSLIETLIIVGFWHYSYIDLRF